jgi:uncharacterized protein
MTEHPNAARIRQLFAAFRAHDLDAVRAAIAEDAVWHFPGRKGKLAGSHRGHDAIFAFLAQVVQLTDGTFGIELENVLADEQVAVALFRGRGARDGRQLDNPTCLKIHLRDGVAVEIWEFVWDLHAVDEFWS